MIYYTSDLHFGNEETLRRSNRPFASTSEMDQALIRNWNAVVGPEDTVYILGDLGLYHGPIPKEQLKQLNGFKHLIRGNYESGLKNQNELLDYFITVTDFNEIDDGEHHVILCHYPILHVKRGFMLHGHLHNSKEESWKILKNLPRVLNCGIDINGFRPVTLNEIIENNRIFYNNPDKGTSPQKRGFHRVPPAQIFEPLPVPNKEFPIT